MKKVHRKVKTSDILGMHRQTRGAIARSKSIDHQLDEDREKRQNEVQLLILGGASAGKSTFIKQLRLHHGDGFPDDERVRLKPLVMENVTDAIHAVLDAMERLHIDIQDTKTKELADSFRVHCPRVANSRLLFPDEDECLPPSGDRISSTDPGRQRPHLTPTGSADLQQSESIVRHSGHCLEIVQNEQFQECYRRRRTADIRLIHAEQYFLEDIERIASNDYVPTVQDILYIRKPTVGVQEHFFHMDGLAYRVIDVAGQKNQRKKWIHFFESVTGVVFFASLSGYNDRLEEDDRIVDLQDSLQTFRELTWNEFLDKTDFILFLNKYDIFVQKIRQQSIKCCFPDYTGGDDAESTAAYIKSQFLDKPPKDKQIYAHMTTATNVEIMRAIIADVMSIVMEINMRKVSQPL